jgi:hypothetical protein
VLGRRSLGDVPAFAANLRLDWGQVVLGEDVRDAEAATRIRSGRSRPR